MIPLTPCYLFDIDGTLADLSHRLHFIKPDFDNPGMLPPKDWNAFYAACVRDKPIEPICDLARTLSSHAAIVLVSGRSDRVWVETERWIASRARLSYARLYMRREGDDRPDYIVKGELLDQIIADGWWPLMAFDDRSRVVKMFRDHGIPCAQVAEGDF